MSSNMFKQNVNNPTKYRMFFNYDNDKKVYVAPMLPAKIALTVNGKLTSVDIDTFGEILHRGKRDAITIEFEAVKEIIRAIAEQSMPHIVIGYIQTVEPLEVILIDDINISLSDQSVIVPSGKQPLQAGDQWYLLAVNRNKIYYFLDKI